MPDKEGRKRIVQSDVVLARKGENGFIERPIYPTGTCSHEVERNHTRMPVLSTTHTSCSLDSTRHPHIYGFPRHHTDHSIICHSYSVGKLPLCILLFISTQQQSPGNINPFLLDLYIKPFLLGKEPHRVIQIAGFRFSEEIGF